MSGNIKIDFERCKGCGLCVPVCPKNSIELGEQSNRSGYFSARLCGQCIGCGSCAVMCPEAAIEVFKDSKIVAVDPSKRAKSQLTREKL